MHLIRVSGFARHPGIAFAMLACLAFSFACAEGPTAGFEELAQAQLPLIDGRIEVPGLQAEVEVLRDPWGIPHIYASGLDDLFFAQGFVQAQDRLWQMEMYRRAGEGRLSEVLGAEALQHDRVARLLMFRARSTTPSSPAITPRAGASWRPSRRGSTRTSITRRRPGSCPWSSCSPVSSPNTGARRRLCCACRRRCRWRMCGASCNWRLGWPSWARRKPTARRIRPHGGSWWSPTGWT